MKKFNQLSQNAKIGVIIGSVVCVGALAGGITYLTLHQNDVSEIKELVTEADFDESVNEISLVLKDGQNKIASGGTYHVTGSTSEGYIVINTDESVKLILDNVSITRSDGSAIHVKGSASVLVELVGENKISSTVNAEDTSPAISAQSSLTLTGSGSIEISSTGKGIKARGTLLIENGNIDIVKSSEGMEATNITISGGNISILASDDGLNVSDKTTKNSSSNQMGMDVDDGGMLTISGGKIYINASGDGIDSNGSVQISGGETYVDGPTNNGNGAVDYNGTMEITGGTLIAVGMSGMAQNASSASQPSILISLTSTYSEAFTFGNISFNPAKSYNSVLISSPELSTGSSYDLKIGGTTFQSVTISNNITNSGSSTGGMMGGGKMPSQGSQRGGAANAQ